MSERERQFRALLAYACEDADVVGLYVFGSRAREDGLVDECSDYNVGVVLRDTDAVVAFDRRWQLLRHADVEVSRTTVEDLRGAGEYGTSSEWSRYLSIPQLSSCALLERQVPAGLART